MKKPFVEPYLFFAGRTDEALEFYKNALGAEIEMIMRFEECPDPMPEGMLAPGFEKKVMHASLRLGETRVMASDGCGGPDESKTMSGFSLSLTLPDEDAVRKAFDALSDGGTAGMPVGKTFWSPCFGMVTDKFGVGWMLTVPEA